MFRIVEGDPTPGELAKRGPLIDVEVRNPHAKTPTMKVVKALLDTGAGISGVRGSLARGLQLRTISSINLSGATGKDVVPVYAVHLNIPGFGKLHTRVARTDNNGPEVIIGRDLMAGCVLIYNGNRGSFVLRRWFDSVRLVS